MAANPAGILEKLTQTALSLCRADSAGISLLDAEGREFYWPAIAGQWASFVGGGAPRDFGPCGTVLDRDAALLFSRPERDFPDLGDASPVIEEALLMPFHAEGKAVGTVWVVLHDKNRRFDAEDLRVMTNLGTFAAAAYQAVVSGQNMSRARQSLHQSALEQGRFAAIIESSADAIVGKNLDGIIESWNPGAERIFGYAAEEVIGKPVTILIPPGHENEEPGILERIRRGERVNPYDTERRRKDGSLVEISLTVSPIKNPDGRIIGASKIARDITERKRAERQISLIAREAEHRTKNLLAIAHATVNLTNADTVAGLKQAIEGRLKALAHAHSMLAQSRWAGADFKVLVEETLAPLCQNFATQLRIDGPKLELAPDAAQSMALAVHELTTNAIKYGALSVPGGEVQVGWSLAADGRFVFRWAESGGPAVKAPARRGFGTRVIDQMIRGQLHGEVRFDWRKDGLVCEITASSIEQASP
jgi:PAS domain S-box-containing protein